MKYSDNKYSLIALGAVFVATIALGGFAYLSTRPIEASVESMPAPASEAMPLKAGWNDFTNGVQSITFESEIVGINGSLFSVSEAIRRGIISKIVYGSNKKVLSSGDRIPPEEEFSVYVADISSSPQIFLNQGVSW